MVYTVLNVSPEIHPVLRYRFKTPRSWFTHHNQLQKASQHGEQILSMTKCLCMIVCMFCICAWTCCFDAFSKVVGLTVAWAPCLRHHIYCSGPKTIVTEEDSPSPLVTSWLSHLVEAAGCIRA